MSRITGNEDGGLAGIKDVALLAGVSPGTVSNVLNHPSRVTAARREAVEEAIRRLGYVRHESAGTFAPGTQAP